MNRAQQIYKASQEFWLVKDSIVEPATFQKGAEWADKHPYIPMNIISNILRIIEAGQDCNYNKLKSYSLRLAQTLREMDNNVYAKMIESKFSENPNIIVQDC